MRLRALLATLALASAFFVGARPVAADTYSITLDQSAPAFETYVTFTTTGVPTHQIKNPRIEVLCYQSGTLVYGEAGAITDSFLLGGGGSIWIDNGGGPADCTANLFYFDNHGATQTYVLLATTSFAAAG